MASLMVAKVVAKATHSPNVGAKRTGRRSVPEGTGPLERSISHKLVQGYKAYIVAIHFCNLSYLHNARTSL